MFLRVSVLFLVFLRDAFLEDPEHLKAVNPYDPTEVDVLNFPLSDPLANSVSTHIEVLRDLIGPEVSFFNNHQNLAMTPPWVL